MDGSQSGRSRSPALLQIADMIRLVADRIGAERSLRQMAEELAGACEHAARGCELLYPGETERAEPRPEMVHQE